MQKKKRVKLLAELETGNLKDCFVFFLIERMGRS